MNTQDRPGRHKARDQQRAWDRLASLEDHPQIQAWLEEADAPPRRFNRTWVAAAGIVLAIALAGGGWLLHSGSTRYQTQVGEQRDVILPDGSKVTLNTDTELAVRYSGARRYIALERGEAIFAVKHDTGRPFDVVAGGTLTRALGTEFDVDIRSAKVTVSVLEGAVRVAAANAANNATGRSVEPADADGKGLAPVTVLAKGQALEFHARDRRVFQEKADLRRIEAWRTRRLEFSDTPLSEAVEEFNRYSTTRITVGTPELGAVRVSGLFRIGDQEGFLFSLEQTLNVEKHETQNEIVLLRPTRGSPAGS